MNIDSIKKGIVIDHIQAGNSMRIYRYLNLDQLDCSVAIIKNVKSTKMGRKDIIKIDDDIDLTVNIIVDGHIAEKKHLSLPDRIVDVVSCKNPRCITAVEPGLKQIFCLADEGDRKVYRCFYCAAEKK